MLSSTLGIFYGGHNPSAALVQNGRVTSYVEEERVSRIKHSRGSFPIKAIDYCLQSAGISIEQVEAVAWPFDCVRYENGAIDAFYREMANQYDLDQATIDWQRANIAFNNSDTLHRKIQSELYTQYGACVAPPLESHPHHFVHAFHAYFDASFAGKEALILTIDGSGDEDCTVVWKSDGRHIESIRRFRMPHSLGWFYAAITEYLGFSAYEGEYKVMGLAAYGRILPDVAEKLGRVLLVHHGLGSYEIDPKFVHYGPHTYSGRFTDSLPDLLGETPRGRSQPIKQWHRDVAHIAQNLLEDAVCEIVRYQHLATGITRLCVSGGVAHNVKLNGAIYTTTEIDEIFVQPICHDAGTSLGAALLSDYQRTGLHHPPLRHIFYGRKTDTITARSELDSCGIPYFQIDDPAEVGAELLASGLIIGWFQGNSEGGPRALGRRSILADPRSEGTARRVNQIKMRETWRPLCPSVLSEKVSDWFTVGGSEFMTVSVTATAKCKSLAPGIVHVDETSRIQIVDKSTNAIFHRLISSFDTITGVPIVLNTSLNGPGEPICESVRDALSTYASSGLDALIIDRFLVRKSTSS